MTLTQTFEQERELTPATRCLCRRVEAETRGLDCRAKRIDLTAPQCACELHSISEHSPGSVVDDEDIARLVFDYQYNSEAQTVGPNTLTGFDSKGLSVCRFGVYPLYPEELARIIKGKITKARQSSNLHADWIGVIVANVKTIRNLPNSVTPREFCVYDTALIDFRCHADVMQSFNGSPGAMKHRRRDIWKAFSTLIPREKFLDGQVWHAYCSLSD